MEKINLSKFKNNNFSLVLSGGGSLGIAHLGVLKFLNENNLNPNEIIATSMGAIIGAGFACSKSYEDLLLFLDKSKLQNWFKLSFDKFSLISNKKVRKILEELFEDKKFSDLTCDLKIIATDLNSGNSMVFSKKYHPNLKVLDAVLASMALPIIFKPVLIEKKLYVDGYLSSNFPFEFSSNNLIIGVDVIFKKNISDFKENKSLFFNKMINLFNIYDRAFFLQIKNQTKFKLEFLDNKFELALITPDISKFNTFDYGKNNNLILKKGYLEIKNYFN